MGCDIHLLIEYDVSNRADEWGFAAPPERAPAAPFADAAVPFADARYLKSFAEGELLIPRDYALFAALAGIRAAADFSPLIAPRGFPRIATRDAVNHFFYCVLDSADEAFGYRDRDISRAEADDYVHRGVSFYRDAAMKARGEVSNPDWHTPSWLTLAETTAALRHATLDIHDLPCEFRLTLDLLRGLEHCYGTDHARMVFWFDN